LRNTYGVGSARFRWVVLALATVMQLGISLPQQTPAAIGPILTPALHLSRTELGLLTSAIWGGMLLGMLPSGLLADRFGERRVVGAGGLAVAMVLLVAAQADSFLPLFLVLWLAAIAAASGSPGGTRAIAAWFPARERGLAMGVRQTGVTAAGIVTALVLPRVASAFGWPAAFRVVAVGVIVLVAIFVVGYREPPVERTLAAGAPFRLRDLARNHTFLAATAFGFVFMGALGAAVTYTAVALHESARLGVVEAGGVLALLQVGGTAGRIGWGVLSDRLGRRAPVMIFCGGLAVACCLGAAWLVRPGTPFLVLSVLFLLVGLSTMGWNALYITLASELTVDRAATVVGAGTMLNFAGMLLVTPLFGLIADAAHSYTPAWVALAAWCGLGTVLATRIREGSRAAMAIPAA
jgi:MFS family permease